MNRMLFNKYKYKKITFRFKKMNKNIRVKNRAKVVAGKRLIHLIKKLKIVKKYKNKLLTRLNNKMLMIKMN